MVQATTDYEAALRGSRAHVSHDQAGTLLRHDRAAVEAALFGLVFGSCVTAPWMGGGRTFLLDWAAGPHTGVVGQSLLGVNGGLTSGALSTVGFAAIGRVAGPALTWLVMLAVFAVGSLGVSRLVGGSHWARLPAVALYCVNPFVFNRLYAGHLALLMVYALLPFAVVSALRAPDRRGAAALAPALWWAVLTPRKPRAGAGRPWSRWGPAYGTAQVTSLTGSPRSAALQASGASRVQTWVPSCRAKWMYVE